MAINITTMSGGFNIDGRNTSYTFETYYANEEKPNQSSTSLNDDTVLVGTDKGIILLTLKDCTINNTSYKNTLNFLNVLFALKSI